MNGTLIIPPPPPKKPMLVDKHKSKFLRNIQDYFVKNPPTFGVINVQGSR